MEDHLIDIQREAQMNRPEEASIYGNESIMYGKFFSMTLQICLLFEAKFFINISVSRVSRYMV